MRQWRELHPKVRLDLAWANLFDVNLSGCDLAGADLSRANLSEAFLGEANLSGASLDGASLSGANLSGAVLSGADLSRANLTWANLSVANLRKSNLRGANLSVANLTGADLRDADLTAATLRAAQLFGANLGGANLTRADLIWANLSLTFLLGADLTQAVCHTTTFADCNLHEAHGLDSVVHSGPSSIGIDTLMRMRSNLPLQFLQGAGVPESIIRFVCSPEGRERRYYTCFISHCSADAAFVDWLYGYLRKNRVRCWKYDEAEVIGRPVWGSAGRAITAHDKVVVVCSKNSLETPAVLNEIERALQKEDWFKKENGRRIEKAKGKGEQPQLLDAEVLFPVSVDDCLKGWKHSRKEDVVAKHIADFSGWQSHPEKYRHELENLLHALDPETWP